MWITFPFLPSYLLNNSDGENLWELTQSSQIWDTYLKSDSIRSEMRIFRPFAISSKVSAVGEISLFMIRAIVDFEIPVILAT